MKRINKEQREKSVNKWRNIVEDIVSEEYIDFKNEYWTICGFCRCYLRGHSCEKCPLYNNEIENIRICSVLGEQKTHAILAIKEAGRISRSTNREEKDARINKALHHALIVLEAVMTLG